MNISGSGCVNAGDYNEKISASGSAKLDGNVRCIALSCSGSVHASGDVECKEDMGTSGSGAFEKNISARNIAVSGSLRVDGNITAQEMLKCSGGTNCGGDIKCSTLRTSGSLKVKGGVEAEDVYTSGALNIGGLLNAEKIEISICGGNHVGSIGGSLIKIYKEQSSKSIIRMPLLSKVVGAVSSNSFKVDEAIEGDVIAIEHVSVPKVVGRVVAIGEGCEIDLVQYSEEMEVHPEAKVGKCEKI